MRDPISVSDIPLFSRLSPAYLKQVQQLLRFADYQPGDTVIEEGSPSASSVYVIIEGEAALYKRGRCPLTGQAIEYELEVRGRYEIFGWISVLDGRPLPISTNRKPPALPG